MELPSAVVVVVDAQNRRAIEHECGRERRSIRWVIKLPAVFHWCITLALTGRRQSGFYRAIAAMRRSR